MESQTSLPDWFACIMIFPWFIVWGFWARLVVQSMQSVESLKKTGEISPFNILGGWTGKYDRLSPQLDDIRKRSKRFVVLFGLSIIWMIAVWLAGTILYL